MQSLCFFNKNGDYLNFNYDSISETFNGSLIFDENGSDTFKTIGLYTFERIPSFEFAPSDLQTEKFQLFNEYGINISGSIYLTQSITNIEAVNNDINFYSKWIYGPSFEKKFPVGSQIIFDYPIFEFYNPLQSYTVVSTKKNAIMIISTLNNYNFNITYGTLSGLTSSYDGKSISGLNAIGVYNYLDPYTLLDNLSDWNEPSFYEMLYNGRKLNIVNTTKNDSVVTVKNKDIYDKIYFDFSVDHTQLSGNKDLIIETTLKTDLPIIYKDSLSLTSSRVYFGNTNSLYDASDLLKPGTQFTIKEYSNNFLTVAQIPSFLGNTQRTFYDVDSQVIWDGGVYQCIQSYTNSATTITETPAKVFFAPYPVALGMTFSMDILLPDGNNVHLSTYTQQSSDIDNPTFVSHLISNLQTNTQGYTIATYSNYGLYIYGASGLGASINGATATLSWINGSAYGNFRGGVNGMISINPDNSNYWTKYITYIPTVETLLDTSYSYAEVYLTTNKLYFGVSASLTPELTLAFAASKYQDDMSLFNVDLYYENKTLYATPKYASGYIDIKFYEEKVGPTYGVGGYNYIYENIIQTEETLKTEMNIDLSKRSSYNIVFTDIDEYGIIVEINGMVYQQEVQWVYSGLNVDMQRTVDKTLREWLKKYFITLYRLGILASLDYIVNYPYIYFDSLILKSVYPNVPLEFVVKVGTTANYYIQHSNVVFYDIGNVLSITVNNRPYRIDFSTNVSTTLSNWVNSYSSILDEYGIYTSSINNTLYFNIKEQTRIIDYSISIGKTSLPGEDTFIINNKIEGNLGCLITSNGVILTATGSTFYDINGVLSGDTGFATGMITSLNNTIYPYENQEYNIIEVDEQRLVFSYQGPFWPGATYAFVGMPLSSYLISPFTTPDFDLGFTSSLTHSAIILGTGSFYATNDITPLYVTNITDIIYLNISNFIYVLGDNVEVRDGIEGGYYDTISLTHSTSNYKLVYNNVDEYLYVLSDLVLYKIDPNLNKIDNVYNLSGTPYDCIVNETNGDVYVSYSDTGILDVFSDGTLYNVSTSGSAAYGMAYNKFENDIYVNTDSDLVSRIDGSSRSEYTTYAITNLGQSTIVYEPVNSSIYVAGDIIHQINNNVVYNISIDGDNNTNIIFDNINLSMVVSNDTTFSDFDLDRTVNYGLLSNQGTLSISQFDERVYVSNQGTASVTVFRQTDGTVIKNITTSDVVKKLIYNPIRKSMWGIMPGNDNLIEIRVQLSVNLVSYTPSSYNGVYESQFGTLDPNYQTPTGVWLKTRDYIRRPRENFEGENQVQYVWKWLTDDVPSIFMYDFSGTQLPTTGPYAYVGEKPLSNINLNKIANKDISKTASSAYQQTIFGEIIQNLDYINSSRSLSYMPEPLELFVGFNSQDEGVVNSTLLLLKRENIQFNIVGNTYNKVIFTTKTRESGAQYCEISLDPNSYDNFLKDTNDKDRGLKVGQNIQVFLKDNTNTKNKYVSFNNGVTCLIKELYLTSMIVEPLNFGFTDETTTITNYPIGKITYLTTTFKVLDKEVARFSISGQTEIEDIRYETELTNAGKNITADDVFIFKTYDINEQGVDWPFLNRKRKEMLLVKDDIYPYVGSYKAIINAINYFGYNDLELYEYYRNINPNSVDYRKLYKIEIPDIFDNTVVGWKENDFIKHTMPNPNYEITRLFNLTYNITDREGNNVLLYSLPEVLTKLQGLKYWLQRNVIPISHRILDITGRADFVQNNSIVHKSTDAKIFNIYQSMSPIDFSINESYLMPVNSGSTVYNVVVDFFNESLDTIPDYFDLKVRTYQTYPEWRPFKTYQIGSIVSYYQQLYQSAVNNNRLNDPRKYQSLPSWNMNFDYQPGEIVEYKRNFYEFIGTQSVITSGKNSITPYVDVINHYGNWLDVTLWKKLDYLPIQTINEFRTGTQSFNFTIDTNIDPFVTIELTSDNGYGQIYRSKKNYELRSILDINEDLGELDPIDPQYINLVTSTITTLTTTLITTIWQPYDPICWTTTTSTTITITTVNCTPIVFTATASYVDCCTASITNATYSTNSTTGIILTIDLGPCGTCTSMDILVSSDGINYNTSYTVGCVTSTTLSLDNTLSYYFKVRKYCDTSIVDSDPYHYIGRVLQCSFISGTVSLVSVSTPPTVGKLDWRLYASSGGQVRLTINGGSPTINNISSTSLQSGTLYSTTPTTYTIKASWVSGSNNKQSIRICNLNSGQVYYYTWNGQGSSTQQSITVSNGDHYSVSVNNGTAVLPLCPI